MSFASSRIREIERHTTSACTFDPVQVLYGEDDRWETIRDANASPSHGRILNGVALQDGTTIRVSPMERKYGGWDDEHFHENLRVADGEVGRGVVVTFEAMSRECIAIALSPLPSFQLGKTYVTHFGANGNLFTVLRRRLPSNTECIEKTYPGRVCTDSSFQPYWILFSKGILSAGVGSIPGKRCIGTLDDSLYDQLRPGQDLVRFVGIGNSVLGRHGRDIKIRNLVVCPLPNEGISVSDPEPIAIAVDGEEEAAALEEYERECEKARQRALKFGTEYVPPDPSNFLKWSEVRRLRANPEKGFITGIDVGSREEEVRRKRRRERFEREGGNAVLLEEEEQAEEEDVLPVEEAWDKWEMVREIRVDTPKQLRSGGGVEKMAEEDKMEDAEGEEEEEEEADFIPEKIHIFAIDWAAFKQIRTDDIISYFSNYGPKNHVEWLSELSCNVLFEDEYSATRALHSLSQELPSPPPEDDQPDFASMGWRFCIHPIEKIANDRYGRKGTTARILLRTATSLDILHEKPTETPAPPPGFTTKKVLGPDSDYCEPTHTKGKRRKKKARRTREPQSLMIKEEDEMEDDNEMKMDHPALSRGLKSSRDGFTVEEMEKERTAAASVVFRAAAEAAAEVQMKDEEENQ